MMTPEQFAAAQKAHLDTVMGLTAKAFEGLEQLTALNLQTAKASLDEVAGASVAVLSAKDPQSLIALQAGAMKPSADKVAAYGRQVAGIVTASKAELEKVASAQLAEVQKSFLAAVDAATKNAPEGSASGLAFFKSAMATATGAFDNLQKATRQATDAAQANMEAVTATVTKAAAKSKR